ncbi:hypothetical protein CMK22_07740 [Candidatus Poribacteria bacterium]|nr:hypothetical protein [Candidatus Poribacteria bacterium]
MCSSILVLFECEVLREISKHNQISVGQEMSNQESGNHLSQGSMLFGHDHNYESLRRVAQGVIS